MNTREIKALGLLKLHGSEMSWLQLTKQTNSDILEVQHPVLASASAGLFIGAQ